MKLKLPPLFVWRIKEILISDRPYFFIGDEVCFCHYRLEIKALFKWQTVVVSDNKEVLLEYCKNRIKNGLHSKLIN